MSICSCPIAHSTARADAVAEVLDYDFIRTAISQLAGSRHFNLQETLLDGIVEICLAQPSVRAVLASTSKPDVYPDCRTVGIEVLRFQEPAQEPAREPQGGIR